MVRRIVFAFFLMTFGFARPVAAQFTPEWAAHYAGPRPATDQMVKMVVDGAGNVYVTGILGVPTFNKAVNPDIVTLKYAPGGALLWAVKWNNPVGNYTDVPRDLKVDAGGNVYVLGNTWNNANTGPGTGTMWDMVTLKYDPKGVLLWERRYDGPISQAEDAAALALDPVSGGVVVTGSSDTRGLAGSPFPDYLLSDVVTIKYDANGSALWTRRYDSPFQMADAPAVLRLDAQGNLYILGQSGAYRGGSEDDLLLLKYDAGGSLLSTARYAGNAQMAPTGNLPRDLQIDAQGNLYALVIDPVSMRAGEYTLADFLLLKYTNSGALLWTRSWSRAGDDIPDRILLDPAGNGVYVSGSTEPLPMKGRKDFDALVLRYDAGGTLLWQQIYNGPADRWDGGSTLGSVEMIPDPAGSGGILAMIQSQDVGEDFTVLKYLPDGTRAWVYRYDSPAHMDDLPTQIAWDAAGGALVLAGNGGQDLLTVKFRPSSVLQPPPPPPAALTLSSSLVSGGTAVQATVTLSAPALPGGASVRIANSNTDAATAPSFVDIAEGQTTGTFTVTTVPVAATTGVTLSVTYAGVTRSAVLTVSNGSPPPTATLSVLSLSPASIYGGSPSTGTVTLSAPAPTGGAVVALSSSTAQASVPASVTVPAGQTTAAFTVTALDVNADASAVISAAYQSISKTATLTILVRPNAVRGLALLPVTVYGGSPSTATVTLTTVAPAGGVSVTLASSNTSVATVPASVTVPEGRQQAQFTVTTKDASGNSSVTILASANLRRASATLSVLAAPPVVTALGVYPQTVVGGKPATGDVRLSKPAPAGGTVVKLLSSKTGVATVPASITIAAGSTRGLFPITTKAVTASTTVTFSASAGGQTKTANLAIIKP